MSMTYDWERLGDHIRAEMARRGWSQADLSEASGTSPRTVWRLLNRTGGNQIPDSVYQIEEGFGWPTGTARGLLRGEDPIDEGITLKNVVDELLEHLDERIARSRGRERRQLEEKAEIVRGRLRLRGDGGG